MARPIYSDSRKRVTKSGILTEVIRVCDGYTNNLHGTFQGLSDYVMEHITGEVSYTDWIGRVRDAENLTDDDVRFQFLLKFLLGEASAIWSEKGFHYSAEFMTPREHRECGSSGYEGFKGPNGEYDDMPVPLANMHLKIKDDMPEVSIEVVRRARELAGMPTINDDGYVTGEVVKRDSYHFLDVETKARIQQREIGICSALNWLSSQIIRTHEQRVKGFLSAFRNYVRNLGEGEKRISTPDLMDSVPHIKDARTGEDINFEEIVLGVKAVTFALGYRDGILTPQEILISGRKVDDSFQHAPYTPVGMQRGKIDKDLTSKRRTKEHCFPVYTDVFSGYKYPLTISLEPLNDKGSTIRGPQLIDSTTGEPSKELMDFYKDKCLKVPFARPGDWFHKV